MPKSCSADLRKRVIEAVASGASRHSAAELFGIKDKADRQKLVAIMDNLPEVEPRRATLSPDKRRWNHPTTVYRR